MPLTRSRENLLELEQPANVSFTVDLGSASGSQGVRGTSTRQKGRKPIQNNNSTGSDNDSRTRQMINDSMESFRNEMLGFISNEIRSAFQGLNIRQPASQPRTMEDFPNISSRSTGNNNSSDHEPFLADKVLNIIRNWKIKFTGRDNNITVDEFIYRVNILTSNNLRGDFELLCKYAHCLFEGKALEWYWRYHRQTNDIDWNSLTDALRKQYKLDYKDFDILEDIRRRRQRHNENFDDYFEAISELTDKLKTPISDRDLCETISRNLKIEIRHELLHLEISSVSQLRREVGKHEKFIKDVRAHEARRSSKGQISELDNANVDLEYFEEKTEGICTLRQDLTCWNCDKTGHTYLDCLATKRIFCYGCGAKDIYRPNCTNCFRKSGNGLKDVRRT